jgi:DNA-binding CsgD family transcriptional regulator
MEMTYREMTGRGRDDSALAAAAARGARGDNQPDEVGGVTFFEESQLEPLRSDDDHRSASSFVRDLIGAGSARKRESIVRDRLDEMGFDGMGYYIDHRQPDGTTMRGFLSTYAPPEWSKRYFGGHYHEVDPRNVKERRCCLPLVWDLASVKEIADRRPACTRVRRFIEEMEDCGVRSGVFQRLNFVGAQPDETVVSLVSGEPSRRWIDDDVLGAALTLALSINDYLTGCVRLPGPRPKPADTTEVAESGPRLPATQRAVLWHVANGLTDRQIAEKLSLSSHAVDYHLRQLRQRFAVRNRVQLVAATAHLLSS